MKMLRCICDMDHINSLRAMLQVIEVLEKNFAHDDRISTEDWPVLFAWLEKYYCELKEMLINERKIGNIKGGKK